MKKEEIINSVRQYVNSDKAKYAVLINGSWGAGKTYLYENFLVEEIAKVENGKKDRKTNIYISLYGISTVEQLAKELVSTYLLKVKLQGNKTNEKIYSGLSKVTSILSKTFSVSMNGISMNFDNAINEMKSWIEPESMVICFDDLERCSISINDLFGFINNLVEHCNCKVIILADEENIGKMYANTNIEMKYMTLLMQRKIVAECKNGIENKEEKNKGRADDICISDLKKLNELVYSENYVYKDIKEKVIGLSIKYTPNLNEEFQSIIDDTIVNKELLKKLKEKKEKILECMEKCDNSNIRIMRVWLINFERIYNVVEKNYGDNKYFDEIVDRFIRYSIRVACAIGKNKKLSKWDAGTEIGYINLDDAYLLEREGYRFVDDLYRDSIFNDITICRAAKNIEKQKIEEEKSNIEFSKRKAYKELQAWYYLEDEEIRKYLKDCKEEISHNEFAPQNYQNIIALFVVLEQEGHSTEEEIAEVAEMLEKKINDSAEFFDVENFQYDSLGDEGLKKYHKYYDPLYELIMKKNNEKDIDTMGQVLEYKDGKKFLEYCRSNHDAFFSKGAFASLINLDKLKDLIINDSIEGIYNIRNGFRYVYNFSNLYDYYLDDLQVLETFKVEVAEIEVQGKTRKRAIKCLIYELDRVIRTIKNEKD